VEQLEHLRAGLGMLAARLDQARRIAGVVDGIHDAIDRLADGSDV
jgi:hypothetical protein